MLATSFVIPESAAPENEPTTQELEAVIKIVRTKLTVPEEFTEFTWSYTSPSYYSRSGWFLRWRSKDNSDFVSVRCDNEGRISNYNLRRYSDDKVVIPEKSPEDFLDSISAFLDKTFPECKGSLQLNNIADGSLYSHTYSYRYSRVENGIIVPDNSVTLNLDYITGEVTGLSCYFDTDATFADAENLIGEDKAKEILSTNQNMILSYRLKYDYDEENDENTTRSAYLVYSPEKSYVSVDAVTGDVYTERNTWSVKDSDYGAAGGAVSDSTASKNEAAMDSDAEGYELSDEEIAQLEVLKNLISRDDAIKAVTENQYLYKDEKATAVEAQLVKGSGYYPYLNSGKSTDDKELYRWEISFSNPSEESDEKYYPSYVNASVDAQDGKILSYYASVPGYGYYTENELEVPKLIYSEDQAKSVSEEFIKSQIPEKFAQTRLTETNPYMVIEYKEVTAATANSEAVLEPVYRTVSLGYTRTNEGIDFNYNGISSAVDLVTGKITSYDYEWYDDVEFESPSNIISPEDALMSLYSGEGFGANYEINNNYTYNKYLVDENEGKLIDYDSLYENNISTRLVYSCYAPATTSIRASDGKMIYYSGDEYIPESRLVYSDIDSHWAKSIIERFSYLGIGFAGGAFEPDKYMTAEEFCSLLNSCDVYGTGDIDEKAASLTRVQAVKCIIGYLGYDKIAKLENVFITDFADNMNLLPEDVGYIAIAKGFGLVEGDGETFRPYDMLTRAEAYKLCLEMIEYGLTQN